MKTRKFKLTTDAAPDFHAVIEIKNTRAAQTDMRGCIGFFHDIAEKLGEFDGDLILAFLDVIGPELWIAVASTRSTRWAIDEFARAEGYPPLDGSRGIRLVECERGIPDFFDIDEIKEPS